MRSPVSTSVLDEPLPGRRGGVGGAAFAGSLAATDTRIVHQ